jgi:peptidoglycan L-alanyl-D-glutamate endopeptidase CwlK
MINSRNLSDLLPRTAAKAQAFEAACKEAGMDIIFTSTYRDGESQAALYAQGRTKPGPRATNADAGHSPHNFRVAFDFVPVVNGKAIWDDDVLWNRCAAIGRALGLEWGGDFKTFPDKPHFQDLNGFTLEQYREGVTK